MNIIDQLMKIFTYLFLFFNAIIGYAQLYIDDKQFDLGSYDCLWISSEDSIINSFKVLEIRGRFKLSDQYLFYPERFISSENYVLTDQSLFRVNDSLYSFNFDLTILEDDPFSDILFYLCGYALADRDSICFVKFYDISINDVTFEDFTGRIIIKTENGSIPYIRMPQLKVLENPVSANEIMVEAILWQDSDVSFFVYDITGKLMNLDKYEGINAGKRQFNLNIGHLSSGVYIIIMYTDHGSTSERFLLHK
jgi:hypothetical protein